MKQFTILFGILSMLLLSSCKQRTEVVDAKAYLISEDVDLNCSPSSAKELLLSGNLGDDTNYYFCDRRILYKYDVTNNDMSMFYYGNSSDYIATGKTNGIWVIHPTRKGICNYNEGNTYFCYDSIPKIGMDFELVNRRQMPIIGNTIYCSLLSSVNEFDKMPKIAKWRIAGNRLIFDTLFGDFPISYDYGNFALGHMSEFIYNPNDSIIILSSGLMDTISLYDKDGKFLKNVYFGSSFKKPIKKLSLKGLQEQSTSIQWQRQNNYYCRLIYDPWREVYIRTFYRPSENKTDGIIRDDNGSYVLIIADRAFRIKYEVIFENPDYQAGFFVLPVPEGVYILKQKNLYDNENMQIDLFLFD